MLTGTIINALAILAGSAAGILLKFCAGRLSRSFPALGGAAAVRLGERLQDIIMKGVALCVLYIGISGCLKGNDTLVAILSMVLGAVLGELLDLDRRMHQLGDWVQKKTEFLSRGEGESTVSEGFVTASLLFCVGAMAIVGSISDGLLGDPSTLITKGVLDGVTSIVLAAGTGPGVIFSAVPVLVYQGTLTLCAGLLAPVLKGELLREICAAGYLLVGCIGVNFLCENYHIKVANFLPALLVPPLWAGLQAAAALLR